MKIKVKTDSPSKARTDGLIAGIFEGEKLSPEMAALDGLLHNALATAMRDKSFRGKFKEKFCITTLGRIGPAHLVLVGLGKKEDLTPERLRQAAGISSREAKRLKCKKISSLLVNHHGKGAPSHVWIEAAAEGTLLSLYEFTRYKTEEKENGCNPEEVHFLVSSQKSFQETEEAVGRVKKICNAVAFARDLISQPGNVATPTYLATEARKMASQWGLACKVLGWKDMENLGMGALLGVAKGSAEPPRFIILEYRGALKSQAPVVLVGKGLTFDSGGISLKPGQGMEEMKTDMSGGAAVIAALQAVASLKLKINVVGLVPATENMPDGKANKPGDILTTMSGKTIEIINTDAEGRLILSDALCYAERYKPAAVIDIATLTGACVVALGHHATGIMGTDQDLMDSLKAAGEITGERVWPLPLFEEYDEQIKSDVADMKNIGGKGGGSITAAALLKKFTAAYKWAHLDIAGTAWTDKDKPYVPKGAVGVGVRLFVQFLRDMELKNTKKTK